jgi:hypothetical protein
MLNCQKCRFVCPARYRLKGDELELVERTHEGDTPPMALE